MKSLFEQMRDQVAAEQAEGREVKRWVIRTDQFQDVEREARENGELVEDAKTILGIPFEVSDRAGSEDGILFTEVGPQ